MNYAKIYEQIIQRAQAREYIVQGERHHILPRCLGGGDERDNLVQLTHSEHFVAHQLLVKMYPGNHKLIFAVHAMSMDASGTKKGKSKNKQYAWLRRLNSLAISARRTGVAHTPETCAKMSKTRTGRKHSPEHSAAISAALKGVPKSVEHARAAVEARIRTGRIGGRTGQTNSPEHRARQSASIQAYHKRRREALALAAQTNQE